MKRTANSVGDTLIQHQPDDALALALELVAAIEVLLTASGTLRRAFIAADPQALTIAEIVAAMRHGLASTPNVFPFPVTLSSATRVGSAWRWPAVLWPIRGDALTLREASYPPVQYIPRKDVDMTLLARTDHATYCPYKGDCAYYSISLGGVRSANAVWTYESPYAAVAAIRDPSIRTASTRSRRGRAANRPSGGRCGGRRL